MSRARDDERQSSPALAVDPQRPVALAAPVACASRDARVATETLPDEISAPIVAACDTIERHLGAMPKATHRFGSALDGRRKPRSDIDLLTMVRGLTRRADVTCADARPARRADIARKARAHWK
nr:MULTISPECIES: hypothetical protein [Burkholderia]